MEHRHPSRFLGVIQRKVYAVVPLIVEYSITPKGKTAIPIIDTIREYGIALMEKEGIKHS
ncbi:MAG: winged helix-turn-helix transcriptional regulator [Bacteroidota bacterium]